MKKILLIIICLLSLWAKKVDAQITLDTSINTFFGGLGYDFKVVQISSTESKWFFCDTLNNTFSLYNMDFTPFITNIEVPEPFAPSTFYMQVLYVTRELFDCDSSNIEYAYYSVSNPTKPFRVVRTDGTILLQVDSANAPYRYGTTLGGSDAVRPIINTSSGAKLFLQKAPLLNPIYVYSLCGDLPVDIFDMAQQSRFDIDIFPNPSMGQLTFQINSPDNMNEYNLVIFDSNGKEIINKDKINRKNNRFLIDMRDSSNGLYYYSLIRENKIYKSGKFILTK